MERNKEGKKERESEGKEERTNGRKEGRSMGRMRRKKIPSSFNSKRDSDSVFLSSSTIGATFFFSFLTILFSILIYKHVWEAKVPFNKTLSWKGITTIFLDYDSSHLSPLHPPSNQSTDLDITGSEEALRRPERGSVEALRGR